jgi:hypothetical protein
MRAWLKSAPTSARIMGCLVTAAVTALLVSGPAGALSWPWGHQPDLTRDLAGYVQCSDILGTGGYSASPSRLRLQGGGIDQTLIWPTALRSGSAIFPEPTIGFYLLKGLHIPAGQDSVDIHYDLDCRDGDGLPAPGGSKTFSVGRTGYNRHVCARGGSIGLILNSCSPQLAARLGSCAFAAFTAGSGNALLENADVAYDPPSDPKEYVLRALSKIDRSGLLGVAIGCAKSPKVEATPGVPVHDDAVPVTAPPPTPTTIRPVATTASTPKPVKQPAGTSSSPSTSAAPSTTPPAPTTSTTPAPPQTWSETTGGETHTWTNYTNAGGYEGPVIPRGTTVEISCKVQGFKVADGNTWWYRIASSPWNNSYYASADAFYNNGQTSGSLSGTPWVDPNVRDC